jgi:DNA-directed RNA polymerase specialized sigma24 family protein
MLGMPLGTVKGRMRLGLEKIRVTLAEGMGIEGTAEALP